MVKDNATAKRWEVAVCEKGTVHVHYGTGSLHILEEDFLGLAREIQEIAEQLEALPLSNGRQGKRDLLQ
ncbi:MAG: hypothetical protein HY694_15520 [Deltaproteobacteria bacterium]|nr:hypothetical protein [Deltaproteobacteria bacterium]